jgi:tetratricopeptide (TPR) repeat protein
MKAVEPMRRRVLATLALLPAACAAPGPSGQTVEPDLLALTMRHFGYRLEFAETQPLIKARDWNGLAKLGLARAGLNPKRGEWWQVAGYGFLRAGDFAAAREHLGTAVRLLPEEVEVWNQLAVAQARGGDVRAALRTLDRALQTDPVSGVAWVLSGDFQGQSGRAADAIRAYERALEIDRGNVFAWMGRGELAARQGDRVSLEAAIRALSGLYPPYAQKLAAARQ